MRRYAIACVGALSALAAGAQADVLVIPLSAWQAEGGFGNPGNTNASFALPIGTTIDFAEYVDLTYTAQGLSWQSELILSLNDGTSGDFWDTRIAGAPDSPGTFGPVSAPFDNPGIFSSGPFTVTTGTLYVEVYDSFNDAGIDQVISGGSIIVHYTIPAPGAAALLGGAGILALRRRRHA